MRASEQHHVKVAHMHEYPRVFISAVVGRNIGPHLTTMEILMENFLEYDFAVPKIYSLLYILIKFNRVVEI